MRPRTRRTIEENCACIILAIRLKWIFTANVQYLLQANHYKHTEDIDNRQLSWITIITHKHTHTTKKSQTPTNINFTMNSEIQQIGNCFRSKIFVKIHIKRENSSSLKSGLTLKLKNISGINKYLFKCKSSNKARPKTRLSSFITIFPFLLKQISTSTVRANRF